MAEVVVVLLARVPERGVESFRRYERAVLALLPDHGGALQRRLCSEDGLTEVHVVGFPSAEALASYRADPRREQHREILESSAARVEVLELREAPTDELLADLE